jgi:hypothetical protein
MANSEARYSQLAKEPYVTGKRGANPENRFWAKAIDVVMIFGVTMATSFFLSWIPLAMAVIAWGVIDSLGRGQSPGKWLLGLHTIEIRKGHKVGLYNGFIRNLPFLQVNIGILLGGIWGFLFVASGVIWLALEGYFTFQVSTGIRVGDVLGYTRVFDYKDMHTQFIEQFLLDDASHN